MKKITVICIGLVLMLGGALMSGCGTKYPCVPSDTLSVAKVENLADDFIMGMDASAVIAEEQSGVRYYDYDGNEADVFAVLAQSGINYIRVRVWNDPYDKEGNGYGGGNNDISKCVEIGKRAMQYGMKLLVDFHYSDFWADPSKQMVPKAWKGMSIEEKADALYEYTRDCLILLREAGVDVGMVQIGNETNASLCGETKWKNIVYYLMASGSRAVREIFPEALVAVHFANPEKEGIYEDYAFRLNYYGLDYDVFGSSYYPFWHGTLENLTEVLTKISETYGKKIMVMETAYAYTADDLDGWGNTIGTSGYDYKPYPFTVAGQANSVRDVIDTVANKIPNGIGVCYWEGTWIAVGPDAETNREKWETCGSGWATSFTKDYDKNDAGKWYGGCAVENQALFDSDGHPLESLKVFGLVRSGNKAEKYVDGVGEANEIFYTDNAFYQLPATVEVIYSDNSKENAPVVWEDFDLAAARAKGNGKYQIRGRAAGYDTVCNLTVMEKNLVGNYSFETGGEDGWSKRINAGTLSDSHKVRVTNENPQTGKYAFHFWTSDAGGVNFDIEQRLTGLSAGVYKYQVSVLGGGSGTSSVTASKENNYAYVMIDGEIVAKCPIVITCYADGYSDYLIENIVVPEGAEPVIGVHVEIGEANCWGDIDDALFNFVSDK